IAFEDALTEKESRLMIAYGRAAGGPEDPVKIGSFKGIDRIVAGNVHSFESDNITDLGVTTGIQKPEPGQPIALSFLPGSANRFILAPFFLAEQAKGKFNVPLQTAVGEVGPAMNEDAIHNDLVVLAEEPLPSQTDIVSIGGLTDAS